MTKLPAILKITLALVALTACSPLDPPLLDISEPVTVDVVEAPAPDCVTQDDPTCPPPSVPVDTAPPLVAGCGQDNQDAQDCQPPTTYG